MVDAGSGSRTRVTDCERGHDKQPAWSPDGTKIAFATNRDGDYEIYVIDLERVP